MPKSPVGKNKNPAGGATCQLALQHPCIGVVLHDIVGVCSVDMLLHCSSGTGSSFSIFTLLCGV